MDQLLMQINIFYRVAKNFYQNIYTSSKTYPDLHDNLLCPENNGIKRHGLQKSHAKEYWKYKSA